MSDLLNTMAATDNWRCGNGPTSNPSDADLNALFDPCPVPDPAWVSWIDTTSPLTPKAAIWTNCGTATDNDTDDNGAVDREWLNVTAPCTCNSCEQLQGPPATVLDSTIRLNPFLYDVTAHTFTCTSTGGPLVLQYSIPSQVRWQQADAASAYVWIQGFLYRDGALRNSLDALRSTEMWSNTRGYNQPGNNNEFNQVGSFQGHDLTPAGAATYNWEYRFTFYKGNTNNVLPNNSWINFRDVTPARWTAFELCCI